MQGGIETLPSSVLQEILNGRLGAVDLVRVECCSSMFWAHNGIAHCESMSIAEAAAYHSCQTHPVFESLPPRARWALLGRCDGHWKQVVATVGLNHTLIVNGKGELYITSGTDTLPNLYHNVPPEPQSNLRLIFSQPTTNRILQISAIFNHAAFVTETGQVFTFGRNEHCCCGVGLGREIQKPTLVSALEMTPCQQVMTGLDFTVALTRSGELYSWGRNDNGQLGHGHNYDESKPQEVIVYNDNGAPDPMVQVCTTASHVAAVTKAGRLFTWGSGCLGYNSSEDLRPKRVELGGFAELFIVCVSIGEFRSAAIDSSGLTYTWGKSFTGYSCTPVVIDSLKAYRAVEVVVAHRSSFVVLDNGRVYYSGNCVFWGTSHCNNEQSGSFTIRGHKIQSIASWYDHSIMVTMRGAIFGFGWNKDHQLGVVDQSALWGDIVVDAHRGVFCSNEIQWRCYIA